jgi:hypothetical protein
MPRLLQAKYYDLKRNFSTIERGAVASYSYLKSSDLMLWLRFLPQDKPVNDVARPNESNVHYVGSFAFLDVPLKGFLGRRVVKAIEPQDDQSYVMAEGKFVESFSNGSEESFSISTWLKRLEGAQSVDLMSVKGQVTTQNEEEGEETTEVEILKITVDFDVNDSILVSFFDHNESIEDPKIKNFNIAFASSDEWFHLALSYNSEENLENQITCWINGIKIDSENIVLPDGGGYQNPIEIEDAFLQIGRVTIGESVAISEFAAWRSLLTDSDVEAIRLGTTSKISFETSGFLSESPRLQIRSLDHATGSYPGNATHGMPEFNGRYPIEYDDTKALNFISNYAKASIELNPFNPNNPTNVIRDLNKLDRLRFKLKLFNGIGFVEKTFRYVTQASRLGAGTADTIVINAIRAKNAEDLTFLMSRAINDARIGIEAKSVGSKLNLRYHKPGIGSFQSGSRIEVTGDRFGAVREVNQFAIEQGSLLWPAMVPSTSRYADANLVNPHRLDGISAPGQMIIGISDSHVRFTPGQDAKPFDEYRVPNVDSDPFYALGTEANVLPNFSARLASKDTVVIDISHAEGESLVYFSNGTEDQEKHSGVSYYDFDSKTWVPKGLNEDLEFYSSNLSIATGSMLAVIPSTFWGTFPNLEEVPLSSNNIRHLGKPHSFAGFPMASKFDATKKQLIRMKDRINGPFLVEKVEFEVNGVLGAYPPYASRLNKQTVQDIVYSNVSGTNQLGRNIEVYYESGPNVIPEVTLQSVEGSYVLTVRFRSGVTTAQQIIDAIESLQSQPSISSILLVELNAEGASDRPQVVEEIYEFVPED